MATCKTFAICFRQMRQMQGRRVLDTFSRPRVLCFSTNKDEVPSNPFREKYADKVLVKHAQEREETIKRHRSFCQTKEPSSSIYDELLKKEVEDVKAKTRKASKKNAISTSSPNGSPSQYGKKGLDAIMCLEKVGKESAESIKELWREFHSDKDCVSAVLPSSMYDIIQERARKYPVFIYPVPRNEGYDLMIGEFSNHQCYLTSVLNYQTLGENAPWLVAFTHFTELEESKGIVLMVGEVDAKHIATHEAMLIANLIQLYYGTDDESKLSLLKTFNTDPDKFDHMSVVKEMERSAIFTPLDE